MTPEQAQQNLAAIISEYLGDLQRNGKGASASLLKNAADEALAVIEKALTPPDNKDESHA
jgi:hypothetical protein